MPSSCRGGVPSPGSGPARLCLGFGGGPRLGVLSGFWEKACIRHQL